MIEIDIDKKEPVYSIGIVAKKFNISVHTLRLYEAEGLILPYKTASRRRLYSRQDLNRIACIREMIGTKKLNIAGIKWLLAMIPCWELLPCSEEDRKVCDAFTHATEPCWMVPHKAEKCRNLECRNCEVYQGIANCNNFKEYLKANWK